MTTAQYDNTTGQLSGQFYFASPVPRILYLYVYGYGIYYILT